MPSFQIPWSIVSSLFICLICILIFLRFMGKGQTSQMTPLDTVNAFVIGAMVSGVVYDTNVSVWYFVLAILVWMGLNYVVRVLSRANFFRDMFFGSEEYLIKNGKINLGLLHKNNMDMEALNAILRERDIYSVLQVKDLIFETDGNFSVITQKNRQENFILIDNGAPVEENLTNAGKDEAWLKKQIEKFNLPEGKEIFALIYTPDNGFSIVDKDGRITYKAQ